MIARVDGEEVAPESMWWPALNYNQFRWDHRLGNYELELPRVLFTEQLLQAYARCVAELRADDLLVPDDESPLKSSGYPPLEVLPEHSAAFLEAVQVYLWEDIFVAFLPCPPGAGRFMVNSIDTVVASDSVVTIHGRGYHLGPSFTSRA